MNESEFHGPIDTMVVEFPGTTEGTATAGALLDLVDRGLIRLYDLMVVRKGADGTCVEVDLAAEDNGHLRALAPLVAGARSGLVGDDDLAALEEVLEPGTVAAVLVYENAWAVPAVAAMLGEGGDVVAAVRFTAQQIMDALDTVEATV